MKSLFEQDTYMDTLKRIDSLEPTSAGKWGKMTVGQMVWHCQIPLKVAIENKPTTKKGNVLVKLFFKKSMFSDKPWRKNLPTSSFAKATESKDFEQERAILREMVVQFHLLKDRKVWNSHPLFGAFTAEQWGMMQFKHLDHHLVQFGV
jgi:hypothetical protein